MASAIIYLLESSALLASFYLLYIGILKSETFFSFNRFFLLSTVLFSALFPLLSFDFNPTKEMVLEQPIEDLSQFRMSYSETMASWEFDNRSTEISVRPRNTSNPAVVEGKSWAYLALCSLLILYVIGVIVCLSRTFWTFRWIRNLISTHPQEKIEHIKLIKLSHPIAPFSFLNFVFLDEKVIGTSAFNQIITHERAHVQQRHSLDLIFVQLLAAFFWFNPIIWRLIKSLKTTHEYIADSKTVNAGYSLVEYQTLLLRQLISNNSYGLVHNFNLSYIKKRITMMQSKKSGWSGKVKVAMAIVTALAFSAVVVQCNSKIDEHILQENAFPADLNKAAGVQFFMDGVALTKEVGINYGRIKEANFKGTLECYIPYPIGSNASIEITHVSEGIGVNSQFFSNLQEKNVFDLTDIFSAAKQDDRIAIEVRVNPETLRFLNFRMSTATYGPSGFSEVKQHLNLPTLPPSGYQYNGNLDDALTLTISGNQVFLDGKKHFLDEIALAIERSSLTERGVIITKIDGAQEMSLVRKVWNEVRKTNRLRLLYVGKTNSGEKAEFPILLPPYLGSDSKIEFPTIDSEYTRVNNLDLLKIDVGDNDGTANQERVYELVKSHIQKQSQKYIVSVRYDNDDTYNDYLVNLAYVMAGFDQVYQERSQEMFGKDFYDTDKQEYRAVRKGIPKGISIAED